MPVIISRQSGDDADETQLEDSLAKLFVEKAAVSAWMVPHVYHVANDDPLWGILAGIAEPIVFVSWLHPRPAEWVLRGHGVGAAGLIAFNLGSCASAEDCFRACAQHVGQAVKGRDAAIREFPATTRTRWYPVIDYSRCINCKQCMQFCLFGVYELDDSGTVRAAEPNHCKPGCPACSRICPRGAIMFPLCDEEAIAGAPGTLMQPDAAAKAMYKKRTKRRHQQPAHRDDDLDALIDDLDRLTEERP